MGRPRVSNERRIATAVRLPASVHQRLHLTARDRNVSANLIITSAVADYLDRLPSIDAVLTPMPADSRRGGES
ncbi:MAG: hypothetical protein JJE52_03920 [Acidimicrobiia bacterium]|nr:hypothetical protein [Acidimicrobiia bacterium]